MNRDYYAGMTQGRIEERERICDILWKSIGDDRDAPGWRWKRQLMMSLLMEIQPKHDRTCLISEGKWDAGCTCAKGITERVKKV